MVETSPQSLNVTLNKPFPLICTVRAKFDGNPVSTAIQWTLITSIHGMDKQSPVLANSCESGSEFSSSTPEQFSAVAFVVVEDSMETGTFIYRCEATALNTTSFSDTTVFVMVETGMLYLY